MLKFDDLRSSNTNINSNKEARAGITTIQFNPLLSNTH